MSKYKTKECRRFAADMEAAGYEVRDYRGRGFWRGPAVTVAGNRELFELATKTRVRLQSDQMGKGLIVYPTVSEPIDEGETL